MTLLRNLLYVVLASCSSICFAADYYVAPNGSSTGAGTLSSPWNLSTGITKLGPGVKLWLRGGVYKLSPGLLLSGSGSATNPTIIRNYNNERVSIEGGSDGDGVFTIAGKYIWLWGLDLYSRDTLRISSYPGAYPADIKRVTPVTTIQGSGGGTGLKIINCVLRDGFNGIGLWSDAVDSEVYGSLFMNNGWEGTDKGWNHGIYTQNRTGTKRIVDNIVFNQFSHGIHAYGSENAYLDNFHIEGNILFNNGGLSVAEGYARNLLLGGGRVAQNARILNNYTYYPATARDGSNNIGYEAGCNNLVAQGNQFVGPVAMRMNNCTNATVSGNLFYGEITGFTQSQYPSNTYTRQRPTANRIFVRPNKYESGRANIVVYNWLNQSSVSVNPGSVLNDGDVYEVIDAQNYFGAPIVKGTYYGGNIVIPMTSTAVTQPVGSGPIPAAHTSVEFGAFVLRRVSGTTAPAPAPVEPSLAVSGVTVSGITANSATISWTTNVPADGQVEYGRTTAFGSLSTVSSALTLTRSITLSGLNAGATYYYRVRSKSGGAVAVSGTATFTTSSTTTPSTGPIYIEAEGGTVAGMTIVSDTTASAGRFIKSTTANAGTVQVTFSVPAAGQYVIWGRVRATNGDNDSLFVKVDGGAEDIWDMAENKWSATWQWSAVNGRNGSNPLTIPQRVFTLSAGTHTLTLRGREVGSSLDRIVITNDRSFIPR